MKGLSYLDYKLSLVPVCEVVDDHVKIFVAQELLVHPAELYWMPIMAMPFDPC